MKPAGKPDTVPAATKTLRSLEPAYIPPEWLANGIRYFLRQLNRLANQIEDRSSRVDEYQPMEWTPDSEAVLSITPEYMQDEIYESIIITGPAAATFTLQIGRWVYPGVMPASAILVIAPVKMKTSQNAQRILTPATPGTWSLRLMGYADRKGRT